MTLFVATALLHSLWLAPAAAAASALANTLVPRRLSLRYAISCAAFFATPIAAVLIAVQGGRGPEVAAATGLVAQWHDWIAAGWILGTSIETFRLMIGLRTIAVLRRTALPVSEDLEACFERLRRRIGVKAAELRLVAAELSPMTVGLFRPAVLLPLSLVTRLPLEQVEGILLHELAHLRRMDRWINALQVVVEAMFFFNPLLRWHSQKLRQERELCCDELAAACSGDALTYARALASTACLFAPAPALGATGGDLVVRIEHLAGEPPARPWRTATALSAAAIVSFALTGDRPDAIARAMRALADERWFVREAAVHELRGDRSDAATEGLVRALNDGNWSIRLDALRELGTRPSPRTTGAIVKRLGDPNWALRSEAIRVLVEHRARSAIPALEERARSDPNWAVRAEAAQAVTALRQEPRAKS